MNPTFGDAEVEFRDEVRAVLAARVPDDSMQFFQGRGGAARELYRDLGGRGWLSLTWPEAHGGAGLPLTYEFLLWDEVAYARAARPDLGPGIVAKTLVARGTPDQQARYLPGIASGDTGFALGYSEPDVGSDLGSVRTRARAVGDAYVVTGQKCWTSDAHNSRYLWLLCRTDSEERGSRGLTILIVDLTADGVTVDPIPTIDGHRLNQVFLDDVVVRAEDRVGEEGAAWRLIREALAVERHLQMLPGRLRRDLRDLVRSLMIRELHDRLDVRAQVARLATALAGVEVDVLATLAELGRGGSGVAAAARAKLRGSTLAQDIARTALDLGGAPAMADGSVFPFLWSQSYMETIAGGTTEVLLGIIAREALGLGATR